jgi:gas vesicle protein
MKRAMSFALGTFFGALVGVTVVLLLTPLSGGELQQAIRERLEAILEEARRAGAARRAEIAARYSITQPSPPQTTASGEPKS